jgi:hypothetical protein
MIFIGIVLILAALIATPIVLVYLFPGYLEKIIVGWLVVVLAIIASLLYLLFRKKAPGR